MPLVTTFVRTAVRAAVFAVARTCIALAGGFSLSVATAQAAVPAPFTGPNLSGVYDCTGQDAHEGPYTATATLKLVPSQSTGPFGAYLFTLDVPGYGSYPGHASVRGTQAAIYFALTDQSTKDYGTGIASFKKNARDKWTFTKHYFEPEFKGGNFGDERCVQR